MLGPGLRAGDVALLLRLRDVRECLGRQWKIEKELQDEESNKE